MLLSRKLKFLKLDTKILRHRITKNTNSDERMRRKVKKKETKVSRTEKRTPLGTSEGTWWSVRNTRWNTVSREDSRVLLRVPTVLMADSAQSNDDAKLKKPIWVRKTHTHIHHNSISLSLATLPCEVLRGREVENLITCQNTDNSTVWSSLIRRYSRSHALPSCRALQDFSSFFYLSWSLSLSHSFSFLCM